MVRFNRLNKREKIDCHLHSLRHTEQSKLFFGGSAARTTNLRKWPAQPRASICRGLDTRHLTKNWLCKCSLFRPAASTWNQKRWAIRTPVSARASISVVPTIWTGPSSFFLYSKTPAKPTFDMQLGSTAPADGFTQNLDKSVAV